MSNPIVQVTYPKQPWYRSSLQTIRALIGRTGSQIGSGILNAVNYAGQGVVQAAELGAKAFPWYNKLPAQDRLGPWYDKKHISAQQTVG